jgi:hypothetical protein
MEVFGEEYAKKRGLREVVLKVLVYWTSSGALVFYLAFLVMPNNLNYAYSILPLEWKGMLSMGLFSLLEGVFTLKLISHHLFNFTFTFIYVSSSEWWLRKVW